MKKFVKMSICFAVLGLFFDLGGLLADKHTLQDDLIRLHVIANSDAEPDQQLKLRIRDAVVSYLSPLTQELTEKAEAMTVLHDNLTKIRDIANSVLDNAGVLYKADVKLTQEVYGTREYDTFSLPAGVYDSLQIQIGAAEGKNWWCVVFPSLCLSATADEFYDVAVSAGFHDTLSKTLAGGRTYEIRFFFLDCLGKLENLFYQ